MGVQRCARDLEFAQSGTDRPATGKVDRQPAPGERGSPLQAMTLADPDRGANSPDRAGITELVPGEAQGVKRRDLGFGLLLRPSEA